MGCFKSRPVANVAPVYQKPSACFSSISSSHSMKKHIHRFTKAHILEYGCGCRRFYCDVKDCLARKYENNHCFNRMEGNIGSLRQWLNEDRIKDPKRMVTNEDLLYWLEPKDTPAP